MLPRTPPPTPPPRASCRKLGSSEAPRSPGCLRRSHRDARRPNDPPPAPAVGCSAPRLRPAPQPPDRPAPPPPQMPSRSSPSPPLLCSRCPNVLRKSAPVTPAPTATSTIARSAAPRRAQATATSTPSVTKSTTDLNRSAWEIAPNANAHRVSVSTTSNTTIIALPSRPHALPQRLARHQVAGDRPGDHHKDPREPKFEHHLPPRRPQAQPQHQQPHPQVVGLGQRM